MSFPTIYKMDSATWTPLFSLVYQLTIYYLVYQISIDMLTYVPQKNWSLSHARR